MDKSTRGYGLVPAVMIVLALVFVWPVSAFRHHLTDASVMVVSCVSDATFTLPYTAQCLDMTTNNQIVLNSASSTDGSTFELYAFDTAGYNAYLKNSTTAAHCLTGWPYCSGTTPFSVYPPTSLWYYEVDPGGFWLVATSSHS